MASGGSAVEAFLQCSLRILAFPSELMPEWKSCFTLMIQLRNINANFIFTELLQSSISLDPSSFLSRREDHLCCPVFWRALEIRSSSSAHSGWMSYSLYNIRKHMECVHLHIGKQYFLGICVYDGSKLN